MAAGDTLEGRRYPDVPEPHEPHEVMEPGGYRRAAGEWEAMTPNGLRGNLRQHTAEEHDDGTITVSPSILVDYPQAGGKRAQWHGFLEHGVWREV